MRMRGSKPIFNIKDTWSLNTTLNPIICAGLKKFKEVVLSKDSNSGVPSDILFKFFPEIKGEYTEEQLNIAEEKWFDILDSMIYTFEDKEPEIGDYKFEFVPAKCHGEKTEGGSIQYNMEVSNREEYSRYQGDCTNHKDKVREGLSLFSEFYECLWW